jgi:LPS-assembly protein
MIRGPAILAVALALGAAAVARAAPADQPPEKSAGPPPATIGIGGGVEPVNVEADRIVYDWEGRIVRLDGHVIVTRGDGILRAGSGVLDRTANTLRLSGGVLAVQGHQVALADGALMDLSSRATDLSRAVLYLKQNPPPPALRNLTDGRAARGLGKNAFTMTAARVQQLAGGRIVARDVTMTPCDCEGSPDYVIESSEAQVSDDRVALSSPWLRIGGVPIPLFPLSLPLGDRQSGMLFPVFGFTAMNGFAFAVPVFLTLGRSYDVTVTPGVFTGNPGTGSSSALGERSIKGPRLALEFRYAPALSTQGEISLDLARNLEPYPKLPAGAAPDSPRQLAGEKISTPGLGLPGANGVRGILRFSHRTHEGPLHVAAQSTLASDVMALPDVEPTQYLERSLGSLPTDVGIWAAGGPWSAGIDSTVLQDTRINNFAFPDRRLFGPEARPMPARLPAAFFQLAPVQAGPFAFSAELSAVRFQTLGGPSAAERDTGYGPTDINFGSLSTAAIQSADPQGLARARLTRLDLSPRLSAALPAGLPIWGRIEAGGRADAWIFENDSVRDTRRAYGLAGASGGLTLSRPYGAFLHSVSPIVELRALTRALRSGGSPIGDPTDAGGASYSSNPNAVLQGIAPTPSLVAGGETLGVPALRRPYDEVDFAAPESGAGEASLRVLQSLWAKGSPGRGPTRVASLELRQDLVLWLPGSGLRAAEASAIASLNVGPLAASLLVRYDWTQRVRTVTSASGSLRDARGDDLHVSTLVLNGLPGSHLRTGIDELFAAVQVAPQTAPAAGSFVAGGNWVLPVAHDSFRLTADAINNLAHLQAGDGQADWTFRGLLGYETRCRCAGLLVGTEVPLREGRILHAPTIRILIDLKSLGSVGTF